MDVGGLGEIVFVPKGITIDDAAEAIVVCRKLGLLYHDSRYLLMPEEILVAGHPVGPMYYNDGDPA